MATIRTALQDEIRDVIYKHLDELGEYVPAARDTMAVHSEQVVACVERLVEICEHNAPESASIELYGEVCSYRHRLEGFLRSMNQCTDSRFERTAIGKIWATSQQWCQKARTQFDPDVDEVWDFIAPAMPDHLHYLGDGQYEARWWKPVPTMDIEILKYTEGVVIIGEPFEPSTLPGGLALRFSISSFG